MTNLIEASELIRSILNLSSRGGGISHDLVDKVTQYNFTTAEESTDKLMQHSGIFGNMMEAVNR